MQQSLSEEDTCPVSMIAPPQPIDTESEISSQNLATSAGWLAAFKQVFPIYLATHIVFLALTYLATLFQLDNFSGKALHLNTLLNAWNRWDTGNFTHIATGGYHPLTLMAFFPLFPLMERGLAFIVHDPFVAGLIISNLATMGMFMVLYRLVTEDFEGELAWRTVLYLAIFPTAFFFAAAYNESLFLFFSLLSFYAMRKGHWRLAGLAAFSASLTRSAAICLFVPFAYEYLRQHDFRWRKIRFDVLGGCGIAGGVILFGAYGYWLYHDPLAFSHAMVAWHRAPSFPGLVFWEGLNILIHHSILTFDSIHTMIDLSAIVFMLVILVLSFTSPWKLPRDRWSYALYAVTIYLFVIIVPEAGHYPLSSLSRYMLENFPAFLVLATLGKKRSFNLYYLAICLPLLAFMLLQWLAGYWIV